MKIYNNSTAICILLGILLFTSQSCSVVGLGIGAALDAGDDRDYEVPINEGEGWIEPENNKFNLRLILSTGSIAYGEYRGMDVHRHGGVTTDIVLVRVNKTFKRIPVSMVNYTYIYHRKRNRTMTGLYIGLGLDLATVFAIAAGGGFSMGPIFTGPI